MVLSLPLQLVFPGCHLIISLRAQGHKRRTSTNTLVQLGLNEARNLYLCILYFTFYYTYYFILLYLYIIYLSLFILKMYGLMLRSIKKLNAMEQRFSYIFICL
jgi:hypothetical protein